MNEPAIITVNDHRKLPGWSYRYHDEVNETPEHALSDALRCFHLKHPDIDPPVVYRYGRYWCIPEPTHITK